MKAQLLLTVSFVIYHAFGFGQSVTEQMTVKQPDCRDILMNAGQVLPRLYAEKSFDSLRVAISTMEQYCGKEPSETFYLGMLLHIQQSTFLLDSVSGSEYFLNIIHTRRYGLPVPLLDVVRLSPFNYPLGNSRQQLNALITTWATDLLTKPNLSSNEDFICHVLAGKYQQPEVILKNEKEKYPQLYTLLNQQLKKERGEPAGIFNVLLGTWIPTGNLRVLGTHPTVGFQIGGRDSRDAFMLDIHVRFLRAANTYTVRRADSAYQLRYYLGLYLGGEYNHYFYRSYHFEAGLAAGLGYDGFSITGSSDDRDAYLKPYNIGSVNTSAGLRFNYFFNPQLSIGIVGKYNAIWYKNTGGTSLSGHPFSIDVVLGR